MISHECFRFSESFLRGELRVKPRHLLLDEFKLIRAEVVPTEPLIFDKHMGKLANDLIPTSCPPLCLVSNRMVTLFKESNITGWITYPVIVYDKDTQIDGYFGLAVTGHCGKLDNSKCIEKLYPPKSSAGRPYFAWTGYYFDEKTWDGNDFFIPEDTGLIIVTKKVKEIITKHQLTNIKLSPILEIERVDLPIRR